MGGIVRSGCYLLGIGACHLLPVNAAGAQDWPQWRGPNRDGVVSGVSVPTKWPKALTEEWRVPVGEGVASPVVADGKVVVFTRQDFRQEKDRERKILEKANEIVRCLDLRSGKEIWRSEPYLVVFQPWVDADFPWPRSTPAIAAGKI
jgi:hypothetical protein